MARHEIEATYVDDESVHITSIGTTTINVLAEAANEDDTQTAINCDASVIVNHGAACAVTVTDTTNPGQTPTGAVSLASDSPASGFSENPCQLDATGHCTITYNAAGPGAPRTDALTATYNGATGFKAAAPATTTINVLAEAANEDDTQTAINCDASVIVNHGAACAVTVTDTTNPGQTPTGAVSLASDSPASGFSENPCQLDATGHCTITYNAAGPGAPRTDALTATYNGATGFKAAAPATTTINVLAEAANEDDTQTAINCDASVIVNHGAACAVTVTDTTNPGQTPTGAVSLASDSPASGFSENPCQLDATGHCTITYNAAGPGAPRTDALTATYNGATGFKAAAPATTTINVLAEAANEDDTQTAINCDASVIVNHGAACAVTVTDTTNPGQTPTGAVSLASDSPASGFSENPCQLDATGHCTITYNAAGPGAPRTDALTATYNGATGFKAAAPATTTINVLAEAANEDDTQTAINCDASVIVNHGAACAVTVTDTTNPGQTPTGAVSLATDSPASGFSENPCQLDATGHCTITYNAAGPGAPRTDALTATYNGATGFKAAAPATTTINVLAEAANEDDTQTAINCDASVIVNHGAACAVTVTDTTNPGQTPTGAVSLASDSPASGFSENPCQLDATGHCTITYNAAGPGAPRTDALTATYNGATGFKAAAPATTTINVLAEAANEDDTQTAINCDASVIVNHGAACAVTVTDTTNPGQTPTGAVSLASDSPASGFSENPCQLDATGHCTITYNAAGPGAPRTDALTATYNGATGFKAAAPATTTINVLAEVTTTKNDTTTALSCEPASVILGGISACTATVEDSATTNKITPGGNIHLESTAGALPANGNCTVTEIAPGKASCQLAYTPAAQGAGTVKAHYGGDGNHNGSEAETQVTVTAPNGGHRTATAIECEPANVILGGVSICTTTVTDISAAPTAPGGGVILVGEGPGSFNNGGCQLFAISQSQSRCQLLYTPTGAGVAHKITALYPGEPGHEPSSNSVDLTVTPPNGGDQTTTTISCTPGTLTTAESSSCKASVEDTDAASTPTGAVVFAGSGTGTFNPGGCTLSAEVGVANKASCSITYNPLAAGDVEITAAYGGDNGFKPSAPGVTQLHVSVPPPHATQTTLACTSTSLLLPSTTECKATVIDIAPANANPTRAGGEVKFHSDSEGSFSEAAACQLQPDGADASCKLIYTPRSIGSGSHRITASYQGEPAQGNKAGHQVSNATTPLAVTLRPTQTTLSCAPASVLVATAATCTVTVADTTATPSSPRRHGQAAERRSGLLLSRRRLHPGRGRHRQGRLPDHLHPGRGGQRQPQDHRFLPG